MSTPIELYACPCCGQNTLTDRGHFADCLVCFWEDDPIQELHPDMTGANHVSLTQARRNYELHGVSDPSLPFRRDRAPGSG
jgi:hypothetical protein